MANDIVLECQGVHHWFGPKLVLHDVNLNVERGSITSLVGPSGCGKSTLLRAIVGTHPPRQGEILVTPDKGSPPAPVTTPGRNRGIVYQRYSLFPFLTAQENVALGPMLDQTTIVSRLIGYPKWREMRKAHMETAAELLTKLKLERAIKLYPSELSGGMQQRVSIAQALIMKPEILLLDEPFGALDEATREELQRMLLELYLENTEARKAGEDPPYTILIVTHELNEAIYVGDRIVGLSQYWNWKEKGIAAPPGATIVYDTPAPIFDPDGEVDYTSFKQQRRDLRDAVFDPDVLQEAETFRSYWRDKRGA